MKLTNLASATVIVEVGACRILMDPWLTDGEYYGAWAQYPAFDWDGWSFDDIDFIYISHIHPDHVSAQTMRRLPKSIPVLINTYEAKFLRRTIESFGFEVRELPHNQRIHLKGSVHINILAADDCNPEICGQFFGCAKFEVRFGSTQIDSLCVIDDGRYVLVNMNDCPYELSRNVMPKIIDAYGHVDMLLVGYGGAGPYPQCFDNLTEAQKISGADAKKRRFLEQASRYIHDLAPRYYLPFAGQYTLCGRLSTLDDYRGVPEIEEAASWLSTVMPNSCCVLLNRGAVFDIDSGRSSTEYKPVDLVRKRAYRDEVLAKRALDYESSDLPDQAELERLAKAAFGRLSAKRREIGFESDTAVYVELGSDYLARLPMKEGELSIVRNPLAENHVRIATDPRLLFRLLSGPRFAHWNNAEIGSHIRYDRRPDLYERGLYYAMCFFHA